MQDNHFSSNTNKNQSVFWFFTKKLTLSLPATHRAGHNADLPLNRNISKTVLVDIALPKFFERVFDKLSNDMQVVRLCTGDSLVIDA